MDMAEPGIIVTESDLHRLQHCTRAAHSSARDGDAVDALRDDLARAVPVASHEVPPDLVTLDTTFTVRDLASGGLATYTLVVPSESDAARRRISVLAPLGLAALGRRVGQATEWEAPGGVRRGRIEGIVFQPEAARRADADAAARDGEPPVRSAGAGR
jgi:regulator of nucleoside diphosphate kinase